MTKPAEVTTNVFTVPFGAPFLTTVARAILDGALPPGAGVSDDPLALADLTVLLPTPRAVRALQSAFVDLAPDRALLLPVLRPISETDEELALIASAAQRPDPHAALSLPPAMPDLDRQLHLAKLIQDWAWRHEDARPERNLAAPAHAIRLARELAGLMDTLETEQVALAALDTVVPDAYAEHWQATLSFLSVLTKQWPRVLSASGTLAPADRRNQLIQAEAKRVRSGAHAGPMLIAGVTGSIPATADLMAAVAAKPNGAIVLPGLDQSLDTPAFAAIRGGGAEADSPHPEHPQFGFAGLLPHLDIARGDVADVPGAAVPPALRVRDRLVSEAMRPAATTAEWQAFAEATEAAAIAPALEGMSLIVTPTAQDEAEVAALILRETLETPGKTAALVSPDRLLARRVAARLKAWNITVDDSAGRPLRKTPVGAFLDLILEALDTEFAPVSVAALLKHPMTRLGFARGEVRRHARNFELAVFRQLYLGKGLDDLGIAFEEARRATHDDTSQSRRFTIRQVALMSEADWDGAGLLVARMTKALEPLADLAQRRETVPLPSLIATFVAAAEALAEPETPGAASPLWRREDGEAAADVLARLMVADLTAPELGARDLPTAFRALTATENVRTRGAVHPRLSIWGPVEARLQRPDVVILGSLNEGTWPQIPDTGPWLNRPMRRELGLPQPEEATGRAAHDVAQLMGADQVYLTRAEKVDGTPTVPSRWLMRLQAVVASTGADASFAPKRPWLAWALARQSAPPRASVVQPKPCPPVALRPRRLSVTDVGTWLMNPYALYAKKVLRLDALDRLGRAPDDALRGALIHAALADFAAAYPDTLPDDIAEALVAQAADRLRAAARHPDVAAFWKPRFSRFAIWFAETEPDRRAGRVAGFAEVSGRMQVGAGEAAFTLTARADRIDVARDGVSIYDYKGGKAIDTRGRSAVALRDPQLPLEAAIVKAGGFANVEGPLKTLGYISTSGGEPPGATFLLSRVKEMKDLGDFEALADAALKDLENLVAAFASEATPYTAVRRPAFDYRFDAYEQLARVKEWSADPDAGEAAA